MKNSKIKSFAVTGLLMVASLAGTSKSFAAVTTYSSAQINSATSVIYDPAPDSVFDPSGAALTLSAAGTHNLAYNNGSGFTVKPTTDDVYAGASLATGELKTRAILGFGANVSGGPIPVNVRNGNSSAQVSVADSFRAYSGNTPFLWNNGTTASFHFGVTGSSSIPGGLAPASSSLNNIYSFMSLRIYTPGTIDMVRQLQTFDFNAFPDFNSALAAFTALNNAVEARTIGSDYWYFGGAIVPYAIDPAHVLSVNPNTPTEIQYNFTPNGDFDWILNFDTTVQLDASAQNTTVALDFSHTISTSYVAPEGSTTYSASGLFPNTISITSVPEPGTAVFLMLGLGAMLSITARRPGKIDQR